MKLLLQLVLIVTSISSLPLQSQTLTVQGLRERGEMSLHDGYLPKSLESLVGSSTLIVKGRFGEFLGNRPFFAYADGADQSMEAFAESHGFSREKSLRYSVPLSEYEIIVDEVLMGDLEDSKIIFRKYEDADADRRYADPEIERIFFLVVNPDNRTYSARSETSLLSNVDGNYYYLSYVWNPDFSPGILEWKSHDFMPTEAKEVEKAIVTEVQKQNREIIKQ